MVSTRRLGSQQSQATIVTTPGRVGTSQQVFLLDLPVELIDKIFSYVGYKKVSQLRCVSRQMNQICSQALNSTFQKLQNLLMVRFQNVKSQMPRRLVPNPINIRPKKIFPVKMI